MIIFDGLQLIGIAITILILLIVGVVKGIIALNEWRKTGFCKHDFKLDRTNSVGPKHWYKCTKCGIYRLR